MRNEFKNKSKNFYEYPKFEIINIKLTEDILSSSQETEPVSEETLQPQTMPTFEELP